MVVSLKEIDEERLNTDIGYRYQYLTDFMDITEADISLIHGSAPILAPRLGYLTDHVYDKLFSFSCTKKVFFKERVKYDLPGSDHTIHSYHQDTPQVGMRKESLRIYFVRLVTKPYDVEMVKELDRMGRIHTVLGGKNSIHVELIHMNALLAVVQDDIIAELFAFKNSDKEGAAEFDLAGTVRAFCKVLSVQGDFITKWYEGKEKTDYPMRPVIVLTAALVGGLSLLMYSRK